VTQKGSVMYTEALRNPFAAKLIKFSVFTHPEEGKPATATARQGQEGEEAEGEHQSLDQ